MKKLSSAEWNPGISDGCNFQDPASALRAEPVEHGSNTGAWERAGKTAAGSAQREPERRETRR
jgi:hypothetical protein